MLILSSILTTISITNFTCSAINNDYIDATDVGTSFNITTDRLTSSDDYVWYKFTISKPGAGYSFTLMDMPTGEPYSFELYYQEDSNKYPKMLKMNTTLTPTLRRTMHGVLDKAGTYYIRVYSLTGDYTSEQYRLNGSIGYGGYTANLTKVFSSNNLDWAACAEMAGKYQYQKDITSKKKCLQELLKWQQNLCKVMALQT